MTEVPQPSLVRHALLSALAGVLFGVFTFVYSRNDDYSMTGSTITAVLAALFFGVCWGWLMWRWVKRRSAHPSGKV